jgi:hypothetical protein
MKVITMAVSSGIAQVSFVSDSQGHVETVNHSWFDHTGLTVEGSLGGAWRKVIGYGWREAIHRVDLSPLLKSECG